MGKFNLPSLGYPPPSLNHSQFVGSDIFGISSEDGEAALRIGCDPEEVLALLLGMGVQVVAFDDALGVTGLEGGVADGAVSGDV